MSLEELKPVDISRFFASSAIDRNGCWVWQGDKFPNGYANFRAGRESMIGSRVAYHLCLGPIPKETSVLHKCDNRSCVNPSHLFLGSHADNMKDMHSKGRGRAKLQPEQVIEIRLDPSSPTKIAQEYGIHRSQVHRIKTSRSWGYWIDKAEAGEPCAAAFGAVMPGSYGKSKK